MQQGGACTRCLPKGPVGEGQRRPVEMPSAVESHGIHCKSFVAQELCCDGLCEIRSAMDSAKSTSPWIMPNPFRMDFCKIHLALNYDELFVRIRCALKSPKQPEKQNTIIADMIVFHAHFGFRIWCRCALDVQFGVRSNRDFCMRVGFQKSLHVGLCTLCSAMDTARSTSR